MRPIRRLVAHLDGVTRWFEVGEEIPREWEPVVTNRAALDVFPLPVLGPFERPGR